MSRPCAGVWVNAKNDRNGNPRRGWFVVSDQGGAVAFVNEGYSGSAVLRKACPGVEGTAGQIMISPGEFRKLRKLPDACPGGVALEGARRRRRRR